MFRREFLTALALLPFVGRLVKAKTYPRKAAHLDHPVLIATLTDRFEQLLKERSNFVRAKGGGTRSQMLHCSFMSDFQNQDIADEFLKPLALAWINALPPQNILARYRYQPTEPTLNVGCVSYISKGGIRGDLTYDGVEQKYRVTFWTCVISE